MVALSVLAGPRLRPYQQLAVDTILAKIGEHPKAYFAMPTGSGKSIVLASVAKTLLGSGRVLVIAHRGELVEQLAATLRSVVRVPVATLVSGKLTDLDAPVLVALVQSLRPNRLDAWLDRAPVAALLIDEAHHVEPKNTYARVISAVYAAHPSAIVLGCTATPFRTGRARMQDELPKCLFARSIDEMIELNVLAPLTPITIKLRIRLGELRTRSGDYDQGELSEEMRAATRATVDKTLEHIAGRRSIVFAVDRKHATALFDAYRASGVLAHYVHGEMLKPERAATFQAWRSEPAACLVNVGIATEGFDEPTISAVVLAAPTQSAGLYLQRVGRGTRKATGKLDCRVIDVTGSGPIDERQALFADVFADGPMGRAPKHEQKPGQRHLIATPAQDDKNRWLVLESGLFALPIGRGEHWLAGRDADSGLWFARRRASTGRVIERFESEPLFELTEMIGSSVRSMGANPLTSKDARWRTESVTDSQLQRLCRLGVKLDKAVRWTAGQASSMIAQTEIRASIARHGIGNE